MDGIDCIEFIEKYCLINGKPIELKDYQKAFIMKYFNIYERN